MTDKDLASDRPGRENPENTAANIERAQEAQENDPDVDLARTLAETDDVEREASQS